MYNQGGIFSRTKEKQQPSLMQRVEMIEPVIDLLLDSLADLASTEFVEFKKCICKIQYKPYSKIPWLLLNTADLQETVFLIVKNYGQHSVDLTKDVLKEMKLTPLVKKLSDGSSTPKKKHLEGDLSAVIHKVAKVAAVNELLLETLNNLDVMELAKFKRLLQVTYLHRGLPHIPWSQLKYATLAKTVDLMEKTCGELSVEVAREVFIDMDRSYLDSETSSGLKEVKSLEECWPALRVEVELMVSCMDWLIDTLDSLDSKDLRNFKLHLRHLIPYSSILHLLTEADQQEIVLLMVQSYGERAVEMVKKVLKEMKLSPLYDFVFSEKHSVEADKPTLIHKVATVAAVKQRLSKSLEHLNFKELENFKMSVQVIASQRNLPGTLQTFSVTTNTTHIVGTMMEEFGLLSLELIRDGFLHIGRTDLALEIPQFSSAFKVHWQGHSEGVEPIIRGRMKGPPPSVNHIMLPVLLEAVEELNFAELDHFKKILQSTVKSMGITKITISDMEMADTFEIADLILQRCGDQSLVVIQEVFNRMNRPDLIWWLKQRRRLPIAQQQGPSEGVEPVIRGRMKGSPPLVDHVIVPILLEVLNELSFAELVHFKQILPQAVKRRGIPRITIPDMEMANAIKIADLILYMCGDQSLEVTLEVFETMNRPDLIWNLQQRIQWPIAQGSSGQLEPMVRGCMEGTTPLVKHIMVPILLEALQELNFVELDHFKQILQNTVKRRGIPRIIMSDMEIADTFELPGLILQRCGDQSLEITLEVFERMNRPDLVERVSDICSQFRQPLRSMELGGYTSSADDDSDWTKLEPEVNHTDAKDVQTYCLRSEEGQFECTASGLRWVCKKSVSFMYHFCSWEEHIERMESRRYVPAGPLLDITVTAGVLNEVYLPHWICLEDNPKILNKFAVLHVNDCGDEVEKAHEVTATHVKLNEPVFSPRGVLMRAGISVKVHCKVLIYKTNTAFLTLHVYLVPQDPGLQKALNQMNTSYGSRSILKPHPERSLKMKNWFTLTTDMGGAQINPQELKLRYESTTPNFFEVYIENPDRDFKLVLKPRNEVEPVWCCDIRKDEYQRTGRIQGQYFVDKYRSDLIARVSNVGPILDHLLSEGVIHQEEYDQITSFRTSQEKIRRLYNGPLRASGLKGKEIFYTALQENELYLVEDLKKGS